MYNMNILSNPHTHTNFCDGKNSPEEMVKAAIEAGFTALGFSDHSPTPFDPDFPGILDMQGYIREIKRLKEKYRGNITIHLGLELDYYSEVNRNDYDYIIGAVHYIRDDENGVYYALDSTAEKLEACINNAFGGNALAMVERYYDLVVEVARQRPHILAHFDLIRKLNSVNHFFDEESPEYRRIALRALEKAAKSGCIFEINSGGMYRGFTKNPYPAPFLLKRLAEMEVPVILSSDTHEYKSLNYYFDEILSSLPEFGFKEITLLGEQGFYTKKIG